MRLTVGGATQPAPLMPTGLAVAEVDDEVEPRREGEARRSVGDRAAPGRRPVATAKLTSGAIASVSTASHASRLSQELPGCVKDRQAFLGFFRCAVENISPAPVSAHVKATIMIAA